MEDLEINLTGYDYNLESNISTDSNGVSGYVETYDVNGEGDNFKLTIMVVDDTYNIGNVGNLGTTLSGSLNAVAITKYINGKYYWIQISFANDNHNSETYLESIILTQGSDIPNETTTNADSSSQASPSSSSSSSSDNSRPSQAEREAAIQRSNSENEHDVFYDPIADRYYDEYGYI